MAISSSETQISLVKLEVELVKCDSCGFTEECTLAYIIRIREKYNDRWICGLCIEAVKDEILRSNRVITTEEAVNRHISFCQNFISSSPPSNFTASEHPIFAMARVLRRNMDSPRTHRSNPSTPIRGNRPPMILRSESCFPSISS